MDQQDKKAIIKAAERGDLDEVRRLVQQDRGLLDAVWGYSQWEYLSPLTAAAKEGRLEVVRYVLDEGADINLRPRSGYSAVEWACVSGRSEAVALLLARGADTLPWGNGWTPLMGASFRGHTDVVELLLAHGCDHIDQYLHSSEQTALHIACFYGRAEILGLLLGAGADPHLVERHEGRTPLEIAVTEGDDDCVALLQVSSMYAYAFSGWFSRSILPNPPVYLPHTHAGVGVPLPPLQGPPPPRCLLCAGHQSGNRHQRHDGKQPGACVRGRQGGAWGGAA
jgi:ankyrin repeat protein